jgi:hypothetical protein
MYQKPPKYKPQAPYKLTAKPQAGIKFPKGTKFTPMSQMHVHIERAHTGNTASH